MTDFYYPRVGDFAVNKAGKVYRVVKVNRVNTVCQDQEGKMWNVRNAHYSLTKFDGDPGWEVAAPKQVIPGTVFTVASSSGLWRQRWFSHFTHDQLFVAIGGDATKVNFVPLGGKGMAPTTKNYACGTDSVEIQPIATTL
jgi:hypothetical protein